MNNGAKLGWVLGTVVVYGLIMLAVTTCVPPRPPLVIEPLEAHDAFTDTREDAGSPVRRGIPPSAQVADWQKKPPCDADKDEHAINGACYQRTGRSPKDPGGCGAKLLEHGEGCYRAIANAQREPTSISE